MEETQQLHMSIMSGIADIKSGLAVNNSETSNIKTRIGEIQSDVKEAKVAIQVANGRTTKLEQWSNEAQKIIESTAKTASITATDFGKDQAKVWTALKVISILFPTILGLALLVAFYKAKDIATEAVGQALRDNTSSIVEE